MAFEFNTNNVIKKSKNMCNFGSIVADSFGTKYLVCAGGAWLKLDTDGCGVTSVKLYNGIPTGAFFTPLPAGTSFTFTTEK